MNFAKKGTQVEQVEEQVEEQPKKKAGRPPKKKVAVTPENLTIEHAVPYPEKDDRCPFSGSYGTVPVSSVEFATEPRFEVFPKGTIGLNNVRLRVTLTNGESILWGPGRMTLLVPRDKAFRDKYHCINKNSAMTLWDLEDEDGGPAWDSDATPEMQLELIQSQFGPRNVKSD